MSDATAADRTAADAAEPTGPDGVVERVVEDVAEKAQGAVGLVARMGSALSEGFQDGRAHS